MSLLSKNFPVTSPRFIIKKTGIYNTAIDGITGQVVSQDTDAYTVFNYCLTNLPPASGSDNGGGLIFIKEGTYFIDTSLPIVNNMTLMGENNTSTVIALANGADTDLFAYSTEVNIYFPTWIRLTLSGNKANNTVGSAIKTNAYVNDGIIFDCFIRGCSDEGIELGTQWGWRILDNVVEFNEGDGVKIVDGSNGQVTGNKILTNDGNGINFLGAGLICCNNYIGSNGKSGILIDDGDYSIFTGNIISNDNAEVGANSEIDIVNGSLGNIISNNRIDASSRAIYCVNFVNAVSCVVSNNILTGAVTSNIGGTTMTNCVISENLGWITENWGTATNVNDGDTIAHGLETTVKYASVQATVASETASVTGLDATNITVAIKKDDGTAGTQQTIYWLARGRFKYV